MPFIFIEYIFQKVGTSLWRAPFVSLCASYTFLRRTVLTVNLFAPAHMARIWKQSKRFWVFHGVAVVVAILTSAMVLVLSTLGLLVLGWHGVEVQLIIKLLIKFPNNLFKKKNICWHSHKPGQFRIWVGGVLYKKFDNLSEFSNFVSS